MSVKVETPAQVIDKVVTMATITGAITLLSKDTIKADQDTIRVSLTKLDMSIHNNAVQCMLHAEKHGDTSLMRRLLVEIVDAKSGYRRQGLIGWMRKWSPMELKGDTINLQGLDANGNKRVFNVAEANANPFFTDAKLAETLAKPVFQQNLINTFSSGIKNFRAALANTVKGPDGKAAPINPKEPFYDGIHADEMSKVFADIEAQLATIKPDTTKDIRKAQHDLAIAEAKVA